MCEGEGAEKNRTSPRKRKYRKKNPEKTEEDLGFRGRRRRVDGMGYSCSHSLILALHALLMLSL